MKAFLARVYDGPGWPFQLARYLTIGGFVFLVDFGSFAFFLHLGWWVPVVTTVAYGLGTVTHFTLNKYVNFRAHDRPVHSQALTYGIVALTCWLTTLGIVTLSVALGASPLIGKLVAVACNVPLGFLGHRYLTFGRGIKATLQSLGERRS